METKTTCTPLMNENEMAAVLGISIRTLRDLRMLGGGPPVVKEGCRVGYRPSDVGAWFARRVLDADSSAVPAF
jgi:predicted DNA-binding transcriptional regulator AlpA